MQEMKSLLISLILIFIQLLLCVQPNDASLTKKELKEKYGQGK